MSVERGWLCYFRGGDSVEGTAGGGRGQNCAVRSATAQCALTFPTALVAGKGKRDQTVLYPIPHTLSLHHQQSSEKH